MSGAIATERPVEQCEGIFNQDVLIKAALNLGRSLPGYPGSNVSLGRGSVWVKVPSERDAILKLAGEILDFAAKHHQPITEARIKWWGWDPKDGTLRADRKLEEAVRNEKDYMSLALSSDLTKPNISLGSFHTHDHLAGAYLSLANLDGELYLGARIEHPESQDLLGSFLDPRPEPSFVRQGHISTAQKQTPSEHVIQAYAKIDHLLESLGLPESALEYYRDYLALQREERLEKEAFHHLIYWNYFYILFDAEGLQREVMAELDFRNRNVRQIKNLILKKIATEPLRSLNAKHVVFDRIMHSMATERQSRAFTDVLHRFEIEDTETQARFRVSLSLGQDINYQVSQNGTIVIKGVAAHNEPSARIQSTIYYTVEQLAGEKPLANEMALFLKHALR